jgi:uncharacterized protein (DUF1697 family)
MPTFVALLRGINVGSTRKVPMATLRELCITRGLARPETYIQSGNLIVDAEADADEVRALLEPALKKQFGFAVDVVVRTANAWAKYIAANPFAEETDVLPNKLHLYLSRDRISSGAAKDLEQRAQSGEQIRVAGGALWIDYGANGVGGSKLTPALIDKACGSPATGRNWNSVLKIQAMIKART